LPLNLIRFDTLLCFFFSWIYIFLVGFGQALKRLLLEKVRAKRVSLSLPVGDRVPSQAALPPLTETALQEYGLTIYEEPTCDAAVSANSSIPPTFIPDSALLSTLRPRFLIVPNGIWRLSLVSHPKVESAVIEGFLRKRATSTRLLGAWQKRYFRLTTTRLSYWNSEVEAKLNSEPKGSFPVSAFHEVVAQIPTLNNDAITVMTPPSPKVSAANETTTIAPAVAAAAQGSRVRQSRQSVVTANLDSTRVRLGIWGSHQFILEFTGRKLELAAENKMEFSRWLQALFGPLFQQKLIAREDAQQQQQQQQPQQQKRALPIAVTVSSPTSIGSNESNSVGSTTATVAVSPSSVKNVHPSLPPQPGVSHCGRIESNSDVRLDRSRSRGEDSLSTAAALLQRPNGSSLGGIGSPRGSTFNSSSMYQQQLQRHKQSFDDEWHGVEEDGVDSEESQSRTSRWDEDASAEWALPPPAENHTYLSPKFQFQQFTASSHSHEHQSYPLEQNPAEKFNSFMPSASVTPESSRLSRMKARTNRNASDRSEENGSRAGSESEGEELHQPDADINEIAAVSVPNMFALKAQTHEPTHLSSSPIAPANVHSASSVLSSSVDRSGCGRGKTFPRISSGAPSPPRGRREDSSEEDGSSSDDEEERNPSTYISPQTIAARRQTMQQKQSVQHHKGDDSDFHIDSEEDNDAERNLDPGAIVPICGNAAVVASFPGAASFSSMFAGGFTGLAGRNGGVAAAAAAAGIPSPGLNHPASFSAGSGLGVSGIASTNNALTATGSNHASSKASLSIAPMLARRLSHDALMSFPPVPLAASHASMNLTSANSITATALSTAAASKTNVIAASLIPPPVSLSASRSFDLKLDLDRVSLESKSHAELVELVLAQSKLIAKLRQCIDHS
jgi:hypothetical protein